MDALVTGTDVVAGVTSDYFWKADVVFVTEVVLNPMPDAPEVKLLIPVLQVLPTPHP